MAKYRHIPNEVEAVQFTGDNWEEVQTFVGFRRTPEGPLVLGLTPATPFSVLMASAPPPSALLYVAANNATVPIVKGEWILKDSLGCYPCKDDVFKKNYKEVVEVRDANAG